jgi:hypothetical protein
MFKRKPKKLTLRQVHSLYLLLKHALPKQDEKLLIDQTQYIFEHMIPGTLLSSLEIMYKSLPKNLNGITASTLFMRGVMENDFFSYVHFLRTFGRRDS